MTEHLPECPVWRCCKPDQQATMHKCICSYLRACEERVHEIAYAQKRGAGSDAHRQHEIGWMKGYDAALDDARESVADINGKWVFGPRIYKHKALAAIDALREKQ